VVVNMAPQNFRVTGRGELNVNFACSTTPAYADGKLVVRCNVGVKCFDMRQDAARAAPVQTGPGRRKGEPARK